MIFATALKIAIGLQSHVRELKHFDSLQRLEKPAATLWVKSEKADKLLQFPAVKECRDFDTILRIMAEQESRIAEQERQLADFGERLQRYQSQNIREFNKMEHSFYKLEQKVSLNPKRFSEWLDFIHQSLSAFIRGIKAKAGLL